MNANQFSVNQAILPNNIISTSQALQHVDSTGHAYNRELQ